MRLIGRRPGLIIPIGLVAVAVAAVTLLHRPVTARLRSADPAAGTTVNAVPDHISLTFTVPLSQAHLTISGATADRPADVRGKTVTQRISGVRAGAHTVSYHVVLRDGGTLSGTVDFTVRTA
jgi:copper resistance protein C